MAEANGGYSAQAQKNISLLEAEKKAINEQVEIGKQLLDNKTKMAKASSSASKAVEVETGSVQALSKALRENESAVKATIAQSEQLADRFNSLGVVTDNLGAEFGTTAEQSQYLVGAIDDQISAVQAAIQSYADFVIAGGQLSDSQKQIVEDLKETEAQLLATSNAASQMGQSYKGSTVKARYEYDEAGIAKRIEAQYMEYYNEMYQYWSKSQADIYISEMVNEILKAQAAAASTADAQDRLESETEKAAKAQADYAAYIRAQMSSDGSLGGSGSSVSSFSSVYYPLHRHGNSEHLRSWCGPQMPLCREISAVSAGTSRNSIPGGS